MRHKHRLNNYRLVTGDMGQLLPCACVEVLPNDVFRHNSSALVRVTPMIAPLMHPVNIRIHHFFVPNRILWDKWEDFITGGQDGDNQDTVPKIQNQNDGKNLLDYLGVKPSAVPTLVNALPVRAFNMIYNEWYRDQDLCPERLEEDLTIPQIAWEKDYYTSGRPWPQRGPDVTLPLGERAAVMGIGAAPGASYTSQTVRNNIGTQGPWNATSDLRIVEDPDNPGYPGAFVDLTNVTGANVNDVRRAFALQRYQEARAKYGSRYVEYLRYCGVRNPSDARLQIPEYLGGGSVSLSISEVLQVAPETTVPGMTEYGVGDMYGHGIAAMRSNTYQRMFEEHGYVISCLSVRPKAMYANAIERHWLKTDKEDYYQKELAQIGQQPVYNAEIYADSTSPMETFSYQDRYREYKSIQSTVTGEFRDLLNYWHMARDFASAPALNQEFVECKPTKRVYAEQTQNDLWMMVQHRIKARRMVPRNPGSRIL